MATLLKGSQLELPIIDGKRFVARMDALDRPEWWSVWDDDAYKLGVDHEPDSGCSMVAWACTSKGEAHDLADALNAVMPTVKVLWEKGKNEYADTPGADQEDFSVWYRIDAEHALNVYYCACERRLEARMYPAVNGNIITNDYSFLLFSER